MAGAATYVLTAGGTGGHLYPAQALADELLARGHRLILMTDRRGRAWSDRFSGAEIVEIPAASPSGSLFSRAGALWHLMRGALKAMGHLRRLRPAAVVGFGGYASFPALWAASRLKLPIVLHEQNAHLGKVNRVFAERATAVALSFADTSAVPLGAQAHLTGNPVRQAVLNVRDSIYADPGHDGPIRLLIFGGSQGASIFADVLPEAVGRLPEKLRSRVEVVQQARPEDQDRVRTTYAKLGIQADTAPFFDDMDRRLAAAHLVVARAGASTVSELAIAGRPSVLVPYPFAADDHQSANAAALTSAGAAWAVPNDRFDVATCARTLEALLEDPAALRKMGAAAYALGRPDAAGRLAGLVEIQGDAA